MYRMIFALLFVLASSAWAQEDPSAADPAADAATESVEPASAEDLGDPVLDDQADHTEDDEDVFKPTDVVSYEQSVPFPVDI